MCESFAVVRSTFQEKDCRIAMCHKGEGGTECCCVNIHKQVEEREGQRKKNKDRPVIHSCGCVYFTGNEAFVVNLVGDTLSSLSCQGGRK